MAWDDLIALAGGAAEGYESKRRFDKQQEMTAERFDVQQKAAELRAMIEQLKESGRNTRNTENEGGRNTRAEQTSGDRRYGVDTRSADAHYGVDTRDATQRRGQDQQDAQAWDASARWWEGDATSRRGQDVGAATARRGQDIGATTANDNRASTDAARGEQYALRAYEAEIGRLKQNTPSLFGGDAPKPPPTYNEWLRDSADPEIFPSVRNAHAAIQAPPAATGMPGDVPLPATSAPMAAPPANRPAPPVPPRPSMPAGAAPLPITPQTPPARPGPLPITPQTPKPVQQSLAAPGLDTQARALIDKIKAADAQGQDSSALRSQLAALRAQVK